MPIDVSGQGWNPVTTQLKQEWFSKFAYYHLNLKRWEIAKMPGYSYRDTPYYHFIDATAGAGYIPFIGDSSPVRHAAAAQKHRAKSNIKRPLWVTAHLIENNPQSSFELKNRLETMRHLMRAEPFYDCMIHEGKYQKIISREFIERASQDAFPLFGLLYLDPNGQIPEFDLLKRLNHRHPRLDILIHVSATSIKRVRGAFGGLSLLECMQHTGKRFWKIARLGHTHHQWAFLFGSSIADVPDRADMNLYSTDRETGEDVLFQLNYTEKEKRAVCA